MTETDRVLRLPDGKEISGSNPVVIIGPNGSGKTRGSRAIQATDPVEYVNALRSNRLSPQLQVMSILQAQANHEGQRGQARNAPWEVATDFDFVLAQLLAEDSDAARSFRAHVKAGQLPVDEPMTGLEQVEALWARVFEGRKLDWTDWAPIVSNEASGGVPYTASQMSDGERAALYLSAKIMLTTANGIVFIDEPETHLHSLLAVKLWDELERRRPDLRFVYITHDLTFALSRRDPTYLLADAAAGLQLLDVGLDLPEDLRRDLLGAASFSSYARRAIFCEGLAQSYDAQFFEAWFRGRETAVFPVGSCESVRQCLKAVNIGGFIRGVEAIGIIDRDYRSDRYFNGIGADVYVLPLHEIEGIVCIPTVVEALCSHLAKSSFDAAAIIIASVTEDDILRVALERWKLAITNIAEDAVCGKPPSPLNAGTLRGHAASVFDTAVAVREPAVVFDEELDFVRSAASSGDAMSILRVFPCKAIAPAIASRLGQSVDGLFLMVSGAISAASDNDPLYALGVRLEAAIDVLGLPKRMLSAG